MIETRMCIQISGSLRNTGWLCTMPVGQHLAAFITEGWSLLYCGWLSTPVLSVLWKVESAVVSERVLLSTVYFHLYWDESRLCLVVQTYITCFRFSPFSFHWKMACGEEHFWTSDLILIQPFKNGVALDLSVIVGDTVCCCVGTWRVPFKDFHSTDLLFGKL